MLLALPSIFHDFFDKPEDDPLLNDQDSSSPHNTGGDEGDSEDERHASKDVSSRESGPDEQKFESRPPAGGDGMSTSSTQESNRDSLHDTEEHPSKRTKKFVVPYNATTEDLKEVNDAISGGWAFQRIAVSESRASIKPGGKKVIITLELDKPRSLFDF